MLINKKYMPNYHVVPHSQNGWAIKREGAVKNSGFAPTQKGAEKIAKNHAHNQGGGEVIIHRPDGKIRDKDTVSPAKDPFPPRG